MGSLEEGLRVTVFVLLQRGRIRWVVSRAGPLAARPSRHGYLADREVGTQQSRGALRERRGLIVRLEEAFGWRCSL